MFSALEPNHTDAFCLKGPSIVHNQTMEDTSAPNLVIVNPVEKKKRGNDRGGDDTKVKRRRAALKEDSACLPQSEIKKAEAEMSLPVNKRKQLKNYTSKSIR